MSFEKVNLKNKILTINLSDNKISPKIIFALLVLFLFKTRFVII